MSPPALDCAVWRRSDSRSQQATRGSSLGCWRPVVLPSVEEIRVPVPDDQSLKFTELAQGSRLIHQMHSRVGDPAAGSNFFRTAEFYPFESIAQQSRRYLDSAFEHLLFWADHVAPLKFHPDQITHFTLRPCFTLARAALEASAQAVWLLSTTDPVECIRRHVCLLRWDLDEQAKWAEGDRKKELRNEDRELVERVAKVFTAEQVRPPNGYLHVLQLACTNEDLQLNAQDVERLWRVASGAAHGKQWPDQEYRRPALTAPAELAAALFPDTSTMIAILEAAHQMTQTGALQHAAYSGADIAALIAKARVWMAENMPLKDGVSVAVRDWLAWGDVETPRPQD